MIGTNQTNKKMDLLTLKNGFKPRWAYGPMQSNSRGAEPNRPYWKLYTMIEKITELTHREICEHEFLPEVIEKLAELIHGNVLGDDCDKISDAEFSEHVLKIVKAFFEDGEDQYNAILNHILKIRNAYRIAQLPKCPQTPTPIKLRVHRK
jgi:hypothetical protein